MARVTALSSGGSQFEPGHDDVRKTLGEYAALVRLCMIDGTKQAKVCKF